MKTDGIAAVRFFWHEYRESRRSLFPLRFADFNNRAGIAALGPARCPIARQLPNAADFSHDEIDGGCQYDGQNEADIHPNGHHDSPSILPP